MCPCERICAPVRGHVSLYKDTNSRKGILYPLLVECGCGEYGSCDADLYGCVCDVGYKEVSFLWYSRCQDIDECVDYPCEDAQYRVCVNAPGSYTCVCATGTWDGYQCG